ncbi:MAG: peroxiredoxin-like family protein [Rickettsiales bacterium]
MSLNTELEQFKTEFLMKFPAEKAAIMARADEELAATQIEQSALKTGDKAPEFTLPDATGKLVSLSAVLKNGPTIVVFYRGGWCPYCNLELRAYQRLLPEIRKAGGQLVAISPQAPDTSLATAEKNALEYPVLSDVNTDAARGFGILFTLPNYLQKLYSSLGHGMDVVNANGQWTLPVPATYVIGQNGVILAHHVDADYRTRMEPADALAALVLQTRKQVA